MDLSADRNSTAHITHVLRRVVPGRKIAGMSAVLLPFNQRGEIAFDDFISNLVRTSRCGLTPAVNMDTGYANLLTGAQRLEVLRQTRGALQNAPFVAGAFVEDALAAKIGSPDFATVSAEYARALAEIQEHGGTPIVFQCSAIKPWSEGDLVKLYEAMGREASAFLAFELGEMFAPFGRIYSLEMVKNLMAIPALKGMKHSSLNRSLEWQRLDLRDSVRPDFNIYTGNDLAIDMVMYGSDYLLGLSAFAPEAFAARDAFWRQNDPRFFELNDLLQYLGFFAFRPPVPAYKHNVAQFLKLRGRISCDHTHAAATRRPESDVVILADIARRLATLVPAAGER